MTSKVSLHSQCAWLLPVPRRQVQRALSKMLAHSPRPWQSVELHLVRDAAMAVCNIRHLKCSGPTNILSFPACGVSLVDSDNDDVATLILSVDTAQREAFLYGQDFATYIFWLLAHGMGHLMGLDHSPEMDAVCERLFASACEDV